ncbi:MAG: Rieske 2Fe-2S domain-containing protein [Rhodospirillaceae bacterium]|jgi:phthalate 4,5-dioxygenase|nr:Rieske 2Fe-2S domain-containing protein [Rhodospirillaceae bacterium]MBT3887021.1 Rieske 2Fe-2S domain-containing protein [Rhodospirillaceae bacterium]MBT4118056.1 Rieske 2Fe-2S domain-containing protein [Rhodospirillaceae bacterium]MBT4671107.1 Rieske 2Fe-2S domain-containing protein [Rhodospirillaceae bacterium]MBT4720098.1 Rieske 2Fe-2S domain-containing protein [Rhodospirillaceae bacterium]
MTNPAESKTLTETGPGTTMGNLMRQYWLPALKSSELVADGDPVRLMLLGEKLIAFRDSSGRVGVMDHRCPHRCASLFFGRNEEDGIRCVYHGWKFDVEGNCLDMANVPPHQDFKHKVKAKAYKAAERGGVVWVYMGDTESVPGLPDLEAINLPEDELEVTFVLRECNYLQALEGDIDPSHFSFLHFGLVQPDDIAEEVMARHITIDRAPKFELTETEWGLMVGTPRPAKPGFNYWRMTHFALPFWTLTPHGAIGDHIWARGWVPLDDTHTMHVEFSWAARSPAVKGRKDGSKIPGAAGVSGHLANTSDWLGRWRLAANASNDYQIDRAAQRSESYSGMTGILLQDQAITESMGATTDHSFERLAPSDQVITRTRRRLLQTAEAFAATGTPPPGAANPEIYGIPRGGDYLAAADTDWREAYEKEIARLDNRVSPARQAAE